MLIERLREAANEANKISGETDTYLQLYLHELGIIARAAYGDRGCSRITTYEDIEQCAVNPLLEAIRYVHERLRKEMINEEG